MRKPKKLKEVVANEYVEPKFVGEGSTSASLIFRGEALGSTSPNSTLMRRDRAATINPTDKYIHLEGGLNPFYYNNALIDIQYSIQLCQQAYWNVALVRNTIEIMTELCDSRIYLQGGNSTSRKFIGTWLKRINLESLKEQFFREYHRSGNVFLFRFDAKFNTNDSQTLSEIYGADVSKLSGIPLRYVMLNPARIRTNNTVIFQNSQYFQMLTPIEMEKLRYPKTKEDKMLFDSLDPETKQKIKNNIIPYIPLDQEHLYPIFAKKQDYEPFAVPSVFPVLEQINAHIEMQRVDQALARTLDRALLLITNGAKKDEGGINPQTLSTLQRLFQNESVSRTLVADYTTKAEWVVPDIQELLGPEKYTELNRQINIGLNALFFNDNEKFANTSVKTKIFIERLSAPRKKFLQFLQNEVNRVCDIMNFKTYPELIFEDIQLKDEAEFIRLFTRMAELGILTPQQFFTAIDTGKLPDTSQPEYIQEIQKYTDQRGDGLFLPLVGASMQDPNGEGATGAGPSGPTSPGGRPKGSKSPQTKTKKTKPIGASISVVKLRDTTAASVSLLSELEKKSLKAHKKKSLNENEYRLCELTAQAIMLNEPRVKWKAAVPKYIKSLQSPSSESLANVETLAQEHSITSFEATLLYLSQN